MNKKMKLTGEVRRPYERPEVTWTSDIPMLRILETFSAEAGIEDFDEVGAI